MQMPTKHNSKNYDNILRSPELFLEVSREWMDEQMDGWIVIEQATEYQLKQIITFSWKRCCIIATHQ